MNFRILLIITCLIVIGLILFSKKRPKPSRLNLRATSKNLPDLAKTNSERDTYGAKSLDCFFAYNGEDFNAYEVLGIPAGASLDVAKRAFKEISKNNKSDGDLCKVALEALLEKEKRRQGFS